MFSSARIYFSVHKCIFIAQIYFSVHKCIFECTYIFSVHNYIFQCTNIFSSANIFSVHKYIFECTYVFFSVQIFFSRTNIFFTAQKKFPCTNVFHWTNKFSCAQLRFPEHKVIPGAQWAKNGRKTLRLDCHWGLVALFAALSRFRSVFAQTEGILPAILSCIGLDDNAPINWNPPGKYGALALE